MNRCGFCVRVPSRVARRKFVSEQLSDHVASLAQPHGAADAGETPPPSSTRLCWIPAGWCSVGLTVHRARTRSGLSVLRIPGRLVASGLRSRCVYHLLRSLQCRPCHLHSDSRRAAAATPYLTREVTRAWNQVWIRTGGFHIIRCETRRGRTGSLCSPQDFRRIR